MSRVRKYEVLHAAAGWAHVLLGNVQAPAVIHVASGKSVPWPGGGKSLRLAWIGRAIVEALAAALPDLSAFPRVLAQAEALARSVVQRVVAGELTPPGKPPIAAGEAVPATVEAAGARFTCGILRATLDGAACAGRWKAHNRKAAGPAYDKAGSFERSIDPCHRCPAGAARVKLLQVAEDRRKASAEAAANADDGALGERRSAG